MLDFHDWSAGVDYPFITGTNLRVGGRVLPTDAFLDAGFISYTGVQDFIIGSVRSLKPGFVIRIPLDGGALVFEGDGAGTVWAESPTASGFIHIGPGFAAVLESMAAGDDYPGRNLKFEPSLVQRLGGHCVDTVSFYNEETPAIRVATGDIRLYAGVNCRAGMVRDTNSLVVTGEVGIGTPCWPESSDVDACLGFVRAVNGAVATASGGVSIAGGTGVDVTDYPDEHRIVIDFSRAFTEGACDP